MNKVFDYELVCGYICSLIQNELEEHQKIPSENELCERFNVTRATVRQGIGKLKNKGLIYSKQGSGNFVSPKKITYTISPTTTFSQEILKADKQPSLKLLEVDKIPADKEIAKYLDIQTGDTVLYVKNLRFVDKDPFLFAQYYINTSYLENIDQEVKNTTSISKLYKNVYGLTPIRESSEIEIISADNDAKELFGISHDLPIIKISTKTTDQKTKRPIDFCYSHFRSDMAKINVDYKGGRVK